MVLAPIPQLIFGSIGFTIFWILAVFPGVPFLPIGRTAGSLVGAMLMVVSRVMTPDEAYSSIDLPILGLLFGMMVVSIYLERADMFNYLGRLLSWRNQGSKDTLLRISLISAVSSALFTNDTACVVLTEFVLKVARQRNSPPHPFLLALASSANIGSAATPIGNPQNLVIAVQSGISFGEFLIGMLPAVLVGVCVNAGVLMCMYWKVLSVQKDLEDTGAAGDVVVDEDDVYSHRFSPAVMSHLSSPLASPERVGNDVVRLRGVMMNMNYSGEVDDSLRSRVIATTSDVNQNEADGDIQMVFSGRSEQSSVTAESLSKDEAASAAAAVGSRSSCNMIRVQVWKTSVAEMCGGGRGIWKRIRLWKTSVYLITIGMLIALLMGLNMSWTAITAALALIVLDFKDARPSLEKVSYSLLIFFCGMFITVDGFNRTGIPTKVWDLLEPYAKIDRVAGLAVLAVVILVLSNVASNVPTVLLLGARVASSAAVISVAEERKAWLVLAWVSTVAGNLSLVGSAANLIVCEQANRAPPHFGYNLGFWTHLKFGVPSTLIVIAIGLTLIR